MSDGPTITFGPSAADTVVDQFGWEFDDDGYLVDEEGAYVESYSGGPVTFDEFGGIVPDQNGNPTPIRDDFGEVSQWVSDDERTLLISELRAPE